MLSYTIVNSESKVFAWRMSPELRGVLLSLVLFSGTAGVALAGETQFRQLVPGNVFLVGQTVRLAVTPGTAGYLWTLTDLHGVAVANGAMVGTGEQTLTFGALPAGFYEVTGGSDNAQTALAVVADPAAITPERSKFGVMTHFAQGWDPAIMPLIARAGIKHIRDEQYWSDVEPEVGKYKFPTAYGAYMQSAAANGIVPLLEMTFGNVVYDQGSAAEAAAPFTPSGRKGYANYGTALLGQYGNQIRTLEVWNEYNGTWCAGPAAADRPFYYASMLRTAYEAVKAQRPDVTVLGGAAVLIPLGYFQKMFQLGALDYMDAVVIHPYRDRPDDVEKEVAALREMMRAFGGEKPIWVTECGTSDAETLGRVEMARYLVELYTRLLSAGVTRIYWYLFKDHQNFRSGLMRRQRTGSPDIVPTAAYAAYATLIQELYGASFVAESSLDLRDSLFVFEREGTPIRVGWTAEPPVTLKLTAAQPLTVVDMVGKRSLLQPMAGRVEVPLTADPIYIEGECAVAGDDRADTVIGDSSHDFTYAAQSEQGHAGWSFGAIKAGVWQSLNWTLLDYGYRWAGPDPWLGISSEAAHPGVRGGSPVLAVRRWKSPATGSMHLRGWASRSSKDGDGSAFEIYHKQNRLASFPLNAENPRIEFEIAVELVSGDEVDFVVTPGPGADISFDATQYLVRVLRSSVTPPAGPTNLQTR